MLPVQNRNRSLGIPRGGGWGRFTLKCKWRNGLRIMVRLKYAAKKMKNEVARFTNHESNLSCSKSGYCRLRKVVAISREKFFSFCDTICKCCVFYRPNANLFCSKWLDYHVWRDSRIISFNQKTVLTQIATSWFFAKQVWSEWSNANIAFQLVLQ